MVGHVARAYDLSKMPLKKNHCYSDNKNLFTNTRAPAHSKGVYLKISLHNTNVTFFHFSRHLILFRAIRTHLYIFPIKDNLQTIFERIPFGIEKIELLNFEFRTVSWFVDNTGRFFFIPSFGHVFMDVQFVSIDFIVANLLNLLLFKVIKLL